MITELVQYIRPDGEIINLNSPPTRVIQNMSGWGRPDMTMHQIKSPYQHGSSIVSYRLNQRNIRMGLAYRGCSRSDWFEERANLLTSLGIANTSPNLPEEGTLRWEYIEDGQYMTRDLDCYLSRGLVYNNDIQWHNWGISEQLEFIAPNPIIYDPSLVTVTVDTFTESLILPMTFPFLLGAAEATENITYTGTWATNPIIEIDGPTAGIYIENEDLGTILRLDYFIQTGVTVTIDTSFKNKSVTDSLGNNLINYLIDSDLNAFAIEIDPFATGGVNTMNIQVVQPDTTTEVRFKYYNRYYGI